MASRSQGAEYNPYFNAVVLPLTYLYPPFFTAPTDPSNSIDQAYADALNYGGLGALIGHELSHALEAGKYANANHFSRFINEDEDKSFDDIANDLIKQYKRYNPKATPNTVMEDLADIRGLKISGDAYELSLNGAAVPMFKITLPDKEILTLSGYQLLYYNFAETFRERDNENDLTHSSPSIRVNYTF